MFRQRAAEVACFAFIAAVGVQLVASQTLTCYNSSTTCTSTSVRLTGTRPAGQCCLNRGGRSYRASSSTACTPCAIYGFFQSPNSIAPSTTVYQKEGSQLTVYFGFVNGTFSGTHSVSFSVPDNNRYIKSFTTGSLSSAATRQQFTLSIIPDNIALQPPLSVAVSALVDGSSELVLPFNAVILDADVVTIGFRESEYTVTEGASPPDQYARVKLAKDKTIAQPLSVQVVPLTVDQFRPLGIPLPDGITFADLFNPAQYIPNGPMDFDKSILNLTFTSSQREINFNVAIVDDQINEADQQFICIVRLTNPSVNASGNVIIKNPSTVITIADDDLDTSNEFVLPFNAVILDADVVTIGFRESDYTVTEGASPPDQYPNLKLAKDKTIAQQLSVQVMAFTFADLTNPAQYIPNGPMDFDKSILNLTFTSSQTELSPNVAIVDDLINEADQQFICIVRLADPTVFASPRQIGPLNTHPDPIAIAIGFGADTYTFTKGQQIFYADTVKLVKDDGVVSEQTFSVTVIAQPNAVDNQAMFGVDYDMGPYAVQTFTITPDQLSVSIGLAIVGFVNRGAVVTEGGDFIECVAVTDPPPELTMQLSFYIQVLLVPDTADASDVSSDAFFIGPFDNTNRMYCFSINAHEYFEGNQTFTYSLTLIGEQVPVVIYSIVTMVTILDNTTLTIGFDPTQYAVNESNSYVTLGVSILGGATIQGASVGVMFSTGDGTALAGQDYNQTAQLLTFNESTAYIPVAVGIINNGYYEDDISFQANLTLQSAGGYEQFVTLSPAMATATIIDDINGVTIGFDQIGYSFLENQRYARVSVRVLQGQLKKSVAVQFRTIRGSAVGPYDYTETEKILVFNKSTHSINVDVPLVDDGLAEDNESFLAQLLAVSPSGRVTIAPATTLITIIDTNSVIIGFEKQSYQISKHQNQGRLPVKIQVLQGTLGRTVLLHVKTRDGSAIASKNYISIDYDLPALNFSVHELTVNGSIIVNDLAEDDKVFSVELSPISPSSRVTIAPRSAQVTIIDDNAALRVNVTVVAMEDDVPSARSSQHFIASSVRLTIPPYTPPQAELCVAFMILDNKVALEPNKTFSIKVMPSPKVVLLRPISHVLIVDDDAVSVNFTSSNYTSVGSGYTAVCVSKDAVTASNINVEITLTSANASCSEFLNSNFMK
eukprot:Em0010g144a